MNARRHVIHLFKLQEIAEKLILENGLVTLPHPSMLNNWETSYASYPNVMQIQIEAYFRRGENSQDYYLKYGKSIYK